jgi:hypothetical protein
MVTIYLEYAYLLRSHNRELRSFHSLRIAYSCVLQEIAEDTSLLILDELEARYFGLLLCAQMKSVTQHFDLIIG